jgi:hypothetical protein
MTQLSQTGRFFRRWWPLLVTGAVMLVVIGVAGLVALIESSAHSDALAAQREFRGDGVEALVQLVQSDRHTWQERNRAVWALGRLRDGRGLPVLKQFYTGGECDHARLLCQRELRKAIDLCSGTASEPAWLRGAMAWLRRSFAPA